MFGIQYSLYAASTLNPYTRSYASQLRTPGQDFAAKQKETQASFVGRHYGLARRDTFLQLSDSARERLGRDFPADREERQASFIERHHGLADLGMFLQLSESARDRHIANAAAAIGRRAAEVEGVASPIRLHEMKFKEFFEHVEQMRKSARRQGNY